jgi:hypothetical protein
MRRWWILGFPVPPLCFWLGYRCVACPEDYVARKNLGLMGWLLAIVYWIFVVLHLAAFGAVAAIIKGDIGTPEIKARLTEWLLHFLK